jgi:3',5'-cyclic AMP phosphodiesterase CpdA
MGVAPAGASPARLAALCALAAAAPGCFQLSPHELPGDAADQDVHRRSLEALAAEPPPPGPLRVAVVGDGQRSFDEADEIVRSVNRRGDVAFVVQVGDLTHAGTTFEFEVMNRVLRGLDVPYFVVVGNHDLIGNGREVYAHVFGARDLAFTYGRVRFVLLDTNSREYAFRGDVPDLAWLAARLAPDAEHDRAVVFGHLAPNGLDFDQALRAPYLELLRGAGVSLSIHGHAHKFEIWEEGGVRLLVVDSMEHRSYAVVTVHEDGSVEVEQVFF